MTFIKLEENEDSACPPIKFCFKVTQNLSIRVWESNTLLSNSNLKFILGKNMLCDRSSKFDSLLIYLSGQASGPDSKILSKECELMLYKLADTYTEDEKIRSKIIFIVEQVFLSTQGHQKYSADTLIWSSLMYNSSPSNNRVMRESTL